MPIAIHEYVSARGFTANPFATTNAEQEQEQLPSYFVRIPWFDWLLGQPERPESVILFAPRGHGKTSHRMEVARLAGERSDRPALVVIFDSFAGLLHATRIEDYIHSICAATLKALARQLRERPLLMGQLTADPEAEAKLYVLLRRFAVPFRFRKDAPPDADFFQDIYAQNIFSPQEWLEEIARLVRAAGFASVYLLVDGVDELTETREDPSRMYQLLSPLLDAPNLLQKCGFAFKFFLPNSIADDMREGKIGRLDRIPHRTLVWTAPQLHDMLGKRLASFSRLTPTSPESQVTAFRDLCTNALDVDIWLVEVAGTSPRRLIDLARLVFEEHCEGCDTTDALIEATSIERAINRLAVPAVEMSSSIQVSIPVEVSKPPQPLLQMATNIPLLYIDNRNDVYVGNQRLEAKLSKRVRQVMIYLWNHRDRSVTYDELRDMLYSSTEHEREDPHAALVKIIKRLRVAIEPGTQSSNTYIEVQPGIGYVLRNFRDT